MKTRFLVLAAMAALAGCAAPTGDPIRETTFVTEPYPTSVLPAPPPVSTPTPIVGPDGTVIDPALAMVEEDPYGETVEGGADGLTERLPDTCKLAQFQQFQGASEAEVNGAGIAAPFRVIGPTDIVTQEYNPMRVNFYTDESGRVSRIACG